MFSALISNNIKPYIIKPKFAFLAIGAIAMFPMLSATISTEVAIAAYSGVQLTIPLIEAYMAYSVVYQNIETIVSYVDNAKTLVSVVVPSFKSISHSKNGT